jgi:putative glutamine amidotransferase
MQNSPLILITSCTQQKGVEFADASISLSNRYARAILDAGGVPLVMPLEPQRELVEDYVRRADGVVMTGGDDVQTKLYAPKLPKKIAALVKDIEPERDLFELELVDQVFRQHRPLLCMCRGHQMLNVALGGTLIVDIPAQLPGALAHKQMDRKMEPVHDVTIEPRSQLAKLLGAEPLGVNSTHHQAVDRVAAPLKITARSSDGVVEAMELKDARMVPFLQSVQFHPERLYDRFPRFGELFRAFIRACVKKGGPRR